MNSKTAKIGAPGEARTLNLLIRSQALCPIELRGRAAVLYRISHPSPNVTSCSQEYF